MTSYRVIYIWVRTHRWLVWWCDMFCSAVNLPPTLSKSQVSSVRKNLKMQMLALLKLPDALEFHYNITTLLTDLGATQSEVVCSLARHFDLLIHKSTARLYFTFSLLYTFVCHLTLTTDLLCISIHNCQQLQCRWLILCILDNSVNLPFDLWQLSVCYCVGC